MKKAKLKNLDTIRFPRSIRLDNLMQGEKIEYLYAARKVTSGQDCILEVDFFSLKDKGIAFRVFLSKTDFITQKLSPQPMWSNSQLDDLVHYYHYNQDRREGNLVALNERSKKTIASYLRPQLKGEIKPEKPLTPLGMIQSFQKKVRQRQLAKKHQKIKERIDREFTVMDALPEDIYAWIEKYPLWSKQYVFYHRQGKKYVGYCSVCTSEVYPNYAKHKLPGVCPSCGCPITFKAEGRSKNTHDEFIFSYIQKGIDNCIILRVFEGLKTFKEGFDTPSVRFYEARRYAYKEGKPKAYHHGNFKNTGNYRWCEGYPASHMGSYHFTDTGSLYAANLRDALQGTEWRDCRLDKFAETKTPFDPMDYLAFCQKQPGTRFLVEHGLYYLIFEVINGRGYDKATDIKPTTFDILLDNKSFLPLFKEIDISSSELEMIGSFPSKKYIKKDILLAIRKAGITKDLASVFRYTTPVKALNYLAKQINVKDDASSYRDTLILWLDYLHLAEFLDYNMDSSFVLFPSRLHREHDRVNDEYGKVACLNDGEKIALISGKVNEIYGYKNKQFLIRAPKHGKEIKDEGAALRHCVGRYVDEMAKLKTFILFIRDVKGKSKPFYTVEFKNNEVRQCRGFQNTSATPEVEAFLDEWQKQLHRKEQRTLAAVA